MNRSGILSKTFIAASVASLLCSPLIAGAADAASTLQGTWSGTRFSSGKGEDPSQGVKLELTFSGNHVKANRLPSGDIGEGDFTLAADGKSIDAVGATSSFKGKSYFGIFKVEGDTLLWCTTVSGDTKNRPSDFIAEPAKKSFLIVVKKQKS